MTQDNFNIVRTLWQLFFASGLAFFSATAFAASEAAPAAKHVGIVDQLVSLPFMPSKVILVQRLSDNSIQLFPGSVLPNRVEGKHGTEIVLYLLVAPVTLPDANPEGAFNSVFLLFDDDGSFYGTTAQLMTWQQLRDNSVPSQDLQLKVEELNRSVKISAVEANEMQQKLERLRDEASQTAGVDEIIDLKMELVQLKGFGEEHAAELERLSEVVSRGRALPDPDDINQQRQELALHLADAAKVTAAAERLGGRRKQTAVATVKAKLALIRRMQNVDSNSLAKEALRLRAVRRQLETRLNLSPADHEQDF